MTTAGSIELSRLLQVAQVVEDLDRAIAFYRDVLGGRLVATFNPPGLAFFDVGGVRLMLDAVPEARANSHGTSPLYFAVPDVNAAVTELRARGVAIEQEPHMIFRDDAGTFGTAGTEEWMAFFRDPDGNLLSFVSHIPPR